jgi:hypothetical protein
MIAKPTFPLLRVICTSLPRSVLYIEPHVDTLRFDIQNYFSASLQQLIQY